MHLSSACTGLINFFSGMFNPIVRAPGFAQLASRLHLLHFNMMIGAQANHLDAMS